MPRPSDKERIGALAAESKALKARLREAQKNVTALKKEAAAQGKALARTQKRLDALTKDAEARLGKAKDEIGRLSSPDGTAAVLEENRRLASALGEAESDLVRLREAAEEARVAFEGAEDRIEQRLRREFEGDFQAERKRLTGQVQLLGEQVRAQGRIPLLSPGAASDLVDRFVSELSQGASGLRIKDGELRLKVAFGTTGETSGFVLPTVDDAEAGTRDLHEVVVAFGRVSRDQ